MGLGDRDALRFQLYRAVLFILWRSCVYISCYVALATGWAYLTDVARVISPASVFNVVPDRVLEPIGVALVLFAVIGALRPYPWGYPAVLVSGALRLFDTVTQGSLLGTGFYVLLLAFALAQIFMERTVLGAAPRRGHGP